jgi:hypothetical protein
MIAYKLSARFNENYVDPNGYAYGPGGFYSGGSFELEPWVCSLASWNGTVTQEMREVFTSQCRIENAGRFMQIPYFVLSLAAFSLALKWLPDQGAAKIKEIEVEEEL